MVESMTMATPNTTATITRRRRVAPESATDAGEPNPDAVFPVPFEAAFFTAAYMEAPELARLASAVISKWPEFDGVDDISIRYVWRKKGATKANKAVLGHCYKESGRSQFFGECDYTIEIAADHAREVGLTYRQMEAALYHELTHVDLQEDEKTGDPVFKVRGHDAEIFFDEVRRYGLWRDELTQAHDAFAQLELDLTGAGA